MPPSNLDTHDGKYPFNYHVYEVMKEFEVLFGPVAAWFGQPGMGTRFVSEKSVKELVEGGYLRRLMEDEYDQRNEYSSP